MDLRRIESQFESNNDFEAFDSTTNVSGHNFSLKDKLFNACSLFIPMSFPTPLTSAIIIDISFLQLMSLIVNLFYRNEYSEDAAFTVIEYIRLYPIIPSLNSFTLYAFSVVILGVILIVIVSSTILNCFFNKHGYFSDLLPSIFWILTLPVLELLIQPLKCYSNTFYDSCLAECGTPLHLAFLVCSCVLIILWFCLSFLATIITSYSQIYKQDPFAHFPCSFEPLYMMSRLIFLIEYEFIPIQAVRFISLALYMAITIPIFINGFSYYNPIVSLSFISGLGLNYITILVMLLRYWCGTFGVHLRGDTRIILVFSVLLASVFYWKQKRWYMFLLIGKGLKTVNEMDARLHILITAIKQGIKFSELQDYYLEEKEFVDHAQNDENQTYNPLRVERIISSRINGSNAVENETNEAHNHLLASLLDSYEADKLIYKESVPFLLQMACAYLHFKKNPQLAYSALQEVMCLEPNFIYQFTIHMLKLDIFTSVSNQSIKSARKSGQYNKYEHVIQFEAEYNTMRSKMTKQTTIRMDFWSSLRNKPSLNRLHKLGLEMISLNQEVKQSWIKLSSIYPHHIGVLRLYKSYYKNIIGDKEETAQIRKKVKGVLFEKSGKGYDMLFSERTAVIIITSDQRIVRTSRNTEEIFSHNCKWLNGHLITVIMPYLIATQHHKFMEDFYKSGTVSRKAIETYGIDRDGYLIPIKILKKQFYSLSLGMLYIAAIEAVESNRDEQYLITDSKGIVGGITRKLSKKLRLSPSVLSDKKISLKKLCVTADGRPVAEVEGDVVLKFVINTMETKSARVHELTEEKALNVRKDSNDENSNIASASKNTVYLTKCEISSIKYSSGLILKKIKVGKEIESLDGGEKKHRKMIASEMVNCVAIIMKAVRKMRGLLVRAKLRRHELAPIGSLPMSDQSYTRKTTCNEKSLFVPNHKDLRNSGDSSANNSVTEETVTPNNNPLTVLKKNYADQSSKTMAYANDSVRGLLLKTTQKILNTKDMLYKIGLSQQQRKNSSDISGTAFHAINVIRKRNILEFYPSSIKCLKIITQFFILSVLVLLGVRMGVSIDINSRVTGFAPLMYQNAMRVITIGGSGLFIQQIIYQYPYPSRNLPPLLNATIRMQKYDWKEFLRYFKINDTMSSYQDYLINQLRVSSDGLLAARKGTDDNARKLDPGLVEQISPSNVVFEYNINHQYSTVTFPLRSAMVTVVTNLNRMMDNILSGKFNNDEYLSEMVVTGSMNGVLRWIRQAQDIFMSAAYSWLNKHEQFSLGALLAFVVIYIIYFIILIPFLWATSRDLESMLMLFLDISKVDIRSEREKTIKFMRKLYREARMKQREIGGNSNEDTVPIENDNETDQDEQNDDSDREHTEGTKKHGRQKKSYVPYKSNVWKVLLLFIVLSAGAIGIYFVLDIFSKNSTTAAAYELAELRFISRNRYANAYNVPYLYHYIYTNKTGLCGGTTCQAYLTSYYNLRLEEMAMMQRYHKGNLSLQSKGYQTLYENVMEGNACETSELGKLANCSTFLGGLFTTGALNANERFCDMCQSIWRDFERSKVDINTIHQYLNDPRLIDTEVLNLFYLDTALEIMMQYIMKQLPIELSNGITMTVLLMSMFVVIFVTTTICWLIWLVGFMRTSIFDTKSLLSNLPDEVIMKNKTIYSYLASASTSIENANVQEVEK